MRYRTSGLPLRADVLVLDADLRQALVAVRSLGRAGCRVVAAECASCPAPPAFWSRFASGTAVLPDLDDPECFVTAVLELVRRTGARLVVPSHDGTVAVLDRDRTAVEREVRLALPSSATLRVCVDKPTTLALASSLGVPVPSGAAVAHHRDIARVAAEVGLPAIVKPAASWVPGADGAGARLACSDVTTRAELEAQVRAILDAGGTALVQPWLLGRREAVHVFAVEGRIVTSLAQATLRTFPPLGGSSVLRTSLALPDDLGRYTAELVAAVGLTGYAEVEYRRDAAGVAHLMEINPRLSASVEVAARSGVDFPLLLWQRALDLPLTPATRYRPGVRMRWLGGDLMWLLMTCLERRRPNRPTPAAAIATFAGELLRPAAYDYVDRGDLAPAARASLNLLRRLTPRNVRLLRRLARPLPSPEERGR